MKGHLSSVYNKVHIFSLVSLSLSLSLSLMPLEGVWNRRGGLGWGPAVRGLRMPPQPIGYGACAAAAAASADDGLLLVPCGTGSDARDGALHHRGGRRGRGVELVHPSRRANQIGGPAPGGEAVHRAKLRAPLCYLTLVWYRP
jgi:hypothetical protein